MKTDMQIKGIEQRAPKSSCVWSNAFQQGAKDVQKGKNSLFSIGAGKTGYPYTKGKCWILILHDT